MPRFLPLLLLCCYCLQACASTASNQGWPAYRQHYIAGGRVVDTGNHNVSHSESQGFGMLLAEANADRQTFDRLWQWTRHHLQRKDDALFAWRYDPAAKPPVQDQNNASDGDLLIAWALLRAAERWDNDTYAQAASAIRQAIARNLIRQYAGYTVLLPGLNGFERPDQLILNPSYLVYPALQAFAAQAPAEGWRDVLQDSQTLLLKARFGTYQLPPDWLALKQDGSLQPAEGWPKRFGFDAVRVPLYLVWGGMPADSPLLSPFRNFWSCCGQVHAWVALDNGTLSPYPASYGVKSIANLLDGQITGIAPIDGEQEDYYSASLRLLAELARQRNAIP
ncbi:glycosyl hydrolase family 8 [Azomonas macrocytogenes]|uniref:Glucanase n=1 Tax=Azomonas macrocytogenes TaxID=69962 RepID=A0A839T0M2_AZOMA|nr:glycosyl hydrolase family 8 [Azomonas macrocytogenes]MBB3102539.1 endoglucanase [Azomonas macrocytogenes]